MQPKYLVIGGTVVSIVDGQRHYINPLQLVRLYMVRENECILANDENDVMAMDGIDVSSLVVLRPRPDGRYRQARERLAAGKLCSAVLERSLPETVKALKGMK